MPEEQTTHDHPEWSHEQAYGPCTIETPMFSRRHYKAIAEVIRKRYLSTLDNRDPYIRRGSWDEYSYWTGALDAVAILRGELGTMFYLDNPNFSVDEFLKATQEYEQTAEEH